MKRRITVFIISIVILIALAVTAVCLVDVMRKKLYPREYSEYVEKYANEYDVPEALVYAVIRTESSFDPNATSHAGAHGLMQLIPDTMDWLSRLLGEEAPTGDIYDPETNIKYGTYYLRHLYDRFDSWDTAIAAYNAGHGKVGTWLKDTRYSDDGVELKNIPYTETRNYVNKISEAYDIYNELYYENGEE